MLTLLKIECAKTVIHLIKDDRSKKAIEVAIKFVNGDIKYRDLTQPQTQENKTNLQPQIFAVKY